jgi:hypothetical protein
LVCIEKAEFRIMQNPAWKVVEKAFVDI